MFAKVKHLEDEKNRLSLLCEVQRESVLDQLEELDHRTRWMQQAVHYGAAASPFLKFAVPVLGLVAAGKLPSVLPNLIRGAWMAKIFTLVRVGRQVGSLIAGFRAAR